MSNRISDLCHKGVICLSLFVFGVTLNAQQRGCTDPKAQNYDSQATINDGSCLYDVTIKRPREICPIPVDLPETSGIEYLNGKFWSHNDSGNDEILWSIDTSKCETDPTLDLNVNLNDWEDITTDGELFYLGDFGNNSGNRLDLKITIIDSMGIRNGDIWFTYPDQSQFSWPQGDHPYDCEAMIFMRDSLHLFTKDRLYQKTRHYRLPTTPGTYEAELVDSLDIGGLITASDINDRGTIALLGYRESGEIFQLLLFDYPGSRVFQGHKREILLGPVFQIGQAEGICFAGTHDIFYTRESGFGLDARIMGSNVREYTDHITTTSNSEDRALIQIGPSWLQIDIRKPTEVRIYDVSGYLVQPITQIFKSSHISTQDLPTGVYHLVLITEGKHIQTQGFFRM